MKMGKKRDTLYSFVAIFILILGGLVVPHFSQAAEYPTKTITLMIPYGAGGPADTSARILADQARKTLGESIVIVNKSGGGGVKAQSILANMKPDGYNISLTSDIAFVQVPQMRDVPFDPLKDFEFIINYMAVRGGIACLSEKPWKSMKDLVAYSKKNPGKVLYASPGTGGASHVGAEMIAEKEGVQWKMLPFKGSVKCTSALLGKHVDLVISDFIPWKEHARAGNVRILALEEEPRLNYFPDAQGFNELGYKDITVGAEFGICAPKGTPKAIVKTLHDAFKKAMETKTFLDVMKKRAIFASYRSSENFKNHIHKQYKLRGEVLKKLGMLK